MGIQITTTNKLNFKRLKTNYCLRYDIYRCTNFDEILIGTVEHKKQPCRLPRTKLLEYVPSQEWYIDDDVVSYSSNDIEVYVNDVQLTPSLYTYYDNQDILRIHVELNKNDYVLIKYFVDRLEYIDTYIGKCDYKIVPIFDETYVIGKHNFIDWRL